MPENKTQKTAASVTGFLHGVSDERRRQDSFTLLDLMRRITGQEPAMWGPSIVGFGDVHYRYPTGREGDWFAVGFSPRKQNLTVYFLESMDSLSRYRPQLDRLGKYKVGKGCLYINRLSDVDLDVLKDMIRRSWEQAQS